MSKDETIIDLIEVLATYKPNAKIDGEYGWNTKVKEICEIISGEEPSEEYVKKIMQKWERG